MKYLLITFLIFGSTFSFAQKESFNWNFGNGAAISFLPGGNNPVNTINSQLKSGRGCASISDSCTGSLLFYTNGDTIWSRNNASMPNGFGLLGSTGSTQSALIVPKPKSSDGQFYVFTIETGSGNGLSYSVVDMNLNSGFGDVITTMKNINLISPTQEKLTAVRHVNGYDVWIISHTLSTNKFYAYHLSSSGITPAVISTIGPSYGTNDAVGYMKASPDGSKICMALAGASKRADLYDFNISTGKVSNLRSTGNHYSIAYGVEFSPDGSKLYISDRKGITQYDLSTNISGRPLGDSVNFPTSDSRALQQGPDGKIYSNEGNDLGIINDPNLPGNACNYVSKSLSLNKFGNSGLPSFIQSFFSPIKIQFEFICLGIPTEFSLILERSIDSVLWNFGDAGSGAFDTSTKVNPSHLYGSVGTYNVTALIFSSKCNTTQIDTVTNLVEIVDLPVPIIDLGLDTIICPGDSILLMTDGKEPQYLWSTGSTDTSIYVKDAGTYWASGTNGCGSLADTIIVNHFSSSLNADLGPDTNICDGKGYRMSVIQENVQYLWNTGSTDHSILAKDAGEYWVEVSDLCSSTGDTIDIGLKDRPVVSIGNDTIICDDTKLTLDAKSARSTYQWQDFSTAPTFEVEIEGIYYVNVTNECGTSRDDIYVRTEDCACVVTVPNSFTPNSDDINDVFKVEVHCRFKEYEISILNRWGEVIYYSTNPATGWNGDVHGKDAPNGMYTYLITYQSNNPRDWELKTIQGTLYLIK